MKANRERNPAEEAANQSRNSGQSAPKGRVRQLLHLLRQQLGTIVPMPGKTGEWVRTHARFVVFAVVIGMLYIWSSHRAEEQVRLADKLEQDIRLLHSEYLTLQSSLDMARKQTLVAPVADTLLGLKPLRQKPYMLTRNGR